ncbi:MAG TPA: cation diffusion facilitator family transporter, partial [Gammaproteobacteria bacterium]|nr:cation diffusion facilitator family transporter [Gammaproteobacteria bacterium]
MDTLNQGFLFLGLRESDRPADTTYAFGHGQKKYLWNLW